LRSDVRNTARTSYNDNYHNYIFIISCVTSSLSVFLSIIALSLRYYADVERRLRCSGISRAAQKNSAIGGLYIEQSDSFENDYPLANYGHVKHSVQSLRVEHHHT